MKRGGALAIALLATSFSVNGQYQAADTTSTEHLERKIIDDLTSIIHNYDFTSHFDDAVSEEQARQMKWQAEYKPTVQELLIKLQEALQDEEEMEKMFPFARLTDKEMFAHLHLEFDLNNDKITAQTAARDHHGVPMYQFQFDTSFEYDVEVYDEGIKDFVDAAHAQEHSPNAAPSQTVAPVYNGPSKNR